MSQCVHVCNTLFIIVYLIINYCFTRNIPINVTVACINFQILHKQENILKSLNSAFPNYILFVMGIL